ncbi:hypothetical protein HBN50_00690 [Halobacteriovorax sp. GB3]|uniref:hypothetical protein n=1 Tax=Halobacteriovorax sp. GB3 TaxID=2719615 RepID=UPI002362914D|nr:hypothetical protein [Halobacteriovorax sp. GB3]MDD0851583.1 hypothetical protein [Halobacteriovorax sp. GB3]
MKSLITLVLLTFGLFNAYASEQKLENIVTQGEFVEIWSYSGSEKEATINFVIEAEQYLEITQHGEKIAMSVDLSYTVTTIRYEIKSLETLSDREILIAIVSEMKMKVSRELVFERSFVE